VDYEFLNQENIPDYVRSRSELTGTINADAITSITEVGDGNLNLVFIVEDSLGQSVVLKQALPYVRLVGPGWPMTPERGAREANALVTHAALSPGLVPVTYFFDHDRYAIGMENLSGFRVWRGALIEGLRHEGVARDMGRYVADVAFGTSVLGVDAEVHKGLVAQASNPELCKITEDLVFAEPYDDIGRNAVLETNQPDADEHSKDPDMIRAMGEAKWIFMTHAEALIHGDLHTGSVMVRADHGNEGPSGSKAFDSEFAFYGPVSFDIGALWANYAISAARHVALGNEEMAHWSLGLVAQTWNGFVERLRELYPQRIDSRVWKDDLLESLVTRWKQEAWLFAAAKMSRRIVGLAKAADIETLEPSIREGAARGILRLSRHLASQSYTNTDIENFVSLAETVLRDNRTGH
jgi:5-methylthioribose kinase